MISKYVVYIDGQLLRTYETLDEALYWCITRGFGVCRNNYLSLDSNIEIREVYNGK